MTPAISIEETERKMRELLEARMSSVRELVKSRQAVTDLRAQLTEAETEDARRYAGALADGWSERELRELGITPADAKPRARRAARGSRRSGPDRAAGAADVQQDSGDN